MKILFIHGLASSGAYKMSSTLRILLKDSTVIAPDVPIEADRALALLQEICSSERPDAIVGLSLGGFWAQKLRGFPKLLVNSDFHISRLLRSKSGQEMQYLSPRSDGERYFTITPQICDSYERLESCQFDGLDDAERALTRGAFALDDEIVSCRDEFSRHYPGCGVSYPGGHLPNFPQVKEHLLPILEELLKINKL